MNQEHKQIAAIIKIHNAKLSMIEELADFFAENDMFFNKNQFIKDATQTSAYPVCSTCLAPKDQ